MDTPMKLHTYFINLADSTTRAASLQSELDRVNLTATRIDAVDGRGSNPLKFEAYNHQKTIDRHARGLTGGEIACYLSHIKALRAFTDSDADYGLILEDDAAFSPNFKSEFSDILGVLHRGTSWDVLNLTETRSDWRKPIAETGSNKIYRAYYFPMLTTANLWTKAGAEHFLKSKYKRQIAGPFDTELRSYCARRGLGLSLETPIVKPSGAESDIDASVLTRSDLSKPKTRRPIKPRLVRHFPDYLNAWLRMHFTGI